MRAIWSLAIESVSGPVPMPYTSQPSSIRRQAASMACSGLGCRTMSSRHGRRRPAMTDGAVDGSIFSTAGIRHQPVSWSSTDHTRYGRTDTMIRQCLEPHAPQVGRCRQPSLHTDATSSSQPFNHCQQADRHTVSGRVGGTVWLRLPSH
jgi:hypothetical protein